MGSAAEGHRPALQVENLSVGFDGTTVIERLSFEVPHASALATVGPNGAGKSVLAKALIGALRHEGTIRWEANTKIGYVPQEVPPRPGLAEGAAFLPETAPWFDLQSVKRAGNHLLLRLSARP